MLSQAEVVSNVKPTSLCLVGWRCCKPISMDEIIIALQISEESQEYVCLPRLFLWFIFTYCFSHNFYLQSSSLKNGRDKMVNPNRSIWGVKNLASTTFQSSSLCNRPREPLMTSHNRPRCEVVGKSPGKRVYQRSLRTRWPNSLNLHGKRVQTSFELCQQFWQYIWTQCGGIFKFILAGSTWLDKLRDLKSAPHWVQNLISRCVPSQTEVWLSCSQWSLVCIHKNFNRLLFRSEYAQDLSARGFPHEIVSSLYLPTFYWHLLTRWN